MNWVKIYKECLKIGGNQFKVDEGMKPNERFNTIKDYSLLAIKLKAFDQMIEYHDEFDVNELRIIQGLVWNDPNQVQLRDNTLLSKIDKMITVKLDETYG